MSLPMMSQGKFHRLMVGLAGYEMAEDYAHWCRMLGWEPDEPEANRLYGQWHRLYMPVWKAMGSDVFFRHLEAGREVIKRAFG